ncbi:gamma-glutamyl-gamma-aminobutyrate hydrolase family protein [Actinoplanes sp. NPDC000266]
MADRRPLIVIPARFSRSASALRFRASVAATRLLEAVFEAGGEPLVLHPADGPVRERIWMAGGVLLPGGGDLAAHWSGQAEHASQYDVDEVQDAFDLALARVALEDRRPLLAICRGVQVVNVARGGDLIQDLGAAHRGVHDVTLPGKPPLTVSCYHHQGIGRLGEGLRAAAHARDGTIEAVTLDGHDGWFAGVQWHPEDTYEKDLRLFTALVEAASARGPRSW